MIFNILHNYCLTFHYSSVQFRCKGVWNNWSNCRWGPFRQCWRCCIMYPYNRPSKDRCFIFKMHCLQLLKVAEWRWQGPFSTPAPAVSQLLPRCHQLRWGNWQCYAPLIRQTWSQICLGELGWGKILTLKSSRGVSLKNIIIISVDTVQLSYDAVGLSVVGQGWI